MRDAGDPESVAWAESLVAGAPGRDAAVARLHAMLLRAARTEFPGGPLGSGSPGRSWTTWPTRPPPMP